MPIGSAYRQMDTGRAEITRAGAISRCVVGRPRRVAPEGSLRQYRGATGDARHYQKAPAGATG